MEIGRVQETEFDEDRTSTGDWVWWRSGEYRRLSLVEIGEYRRLSLVRSGEYRRLSLVEIGGVQETEFGGDRTSTGDWVW